MFVTLCLCVCFRNAGCWNVPMLGPVAFAQGSKKSTSLIKKEYCRCGPHPLQAISSRVRPPLAKGAGCIGPLFPDLRGRPLWFMASIALWGLHKTLHRRLFLAPHCTLRLSHLSVGGNTRGLEIVGQLDM